MSFGVYSMAAGAVGVYNILIKGTT